MTLDTTEYLVGCALSLVACLVIYNWFRTRNHPPGPWGVPLLGYYPFLTKKPNEKLWELKKTYGDIFSFYIGSQHMICVSEHTLARDILSHPLTLNKPPHSYKFIVGNGGLVGLSGDEWQEQRRFTVSTMKQLGIGRGVWEKVIQEDAIGFARKMCENDCEPVDFAEPLGDSQMCNLLSLLFGRHLNPETDKNDIQVMQCFLKMLVGYFTSVDIKRNLPWVKKLAMFFNLLNYQQFIKALRDVEAIIKKEVDQRMESKEDTNNDDYIGLYLHEIEKKKNSTKPTTFSVENLKGNLFSLYVTGIDSMVWAISWLLLIVVEYPDVQKKICQEIDNVIGRDGVVYYDDSGKLPYTMATIYEMLRWVTINPLFSNRYVQSTFKFGGYTLPKGSHVMCNSWGMLHDPRYFEDPMDFKPERFLVENGTKAVKLEGFGPFSYGKRGCGGYGIAMMTMYVYFVMILQRFTVTAPPGSPIDLTYKFSSAASPKRQKLCFHER